MPYYLALCPWIALDFFFHLILLFLVRSLPICLLHTFPENPPPQSKGKPAHQKVDKSTPQLPHGATMPPTRAIGKQICHISRRKWNEYLSISSPNLPHLPVWSFNSQPSPPHPHQVISPHRSNKKPIWFRIEQDLFIFPHPIFSLSLFFKQTQPATSPPPLLELTSSPPIPPTRRLKPSQPKTHLRV